MIVKPCLRVLPAALGTRGAELVALAESLGSTLDGWQKLAANDILATNKIDELAAFEAVALVSRQCGKRSPVFGSTVRDCEAGSGVAGFPACTA
jgi:hypothetical protein